VSPSPTTSPPDPGVPLDRERIVAAALQIVGEQGVEGLSMRKLARRLGTAPMSLYRHVAGKDELVALVAEAAARQLCVPQVGTGWEATVTAFVDAIRSLLHDHPGVASLVTQQAVLTPGVLDAVERVLDALVAAGLEPPDAATAFAALWTVTVGSVALEQAAATGEAPEQRATRQQAWAAGLQGLVPAGSAMAAAAATWAVLDADQVHAATLGLLLDGIRARTASG
jgi:TetR/AcrR family transcriptional regulator, tetracycline repressor protein